MVKIVPEVYFCGGDILRGMSACGLRIDVVDDDIRGG